MFNQPIPTTLIYSPKSPSDLTQYGVDFTAVLSGFNEQITTLSGLTVSPTGVSGLGVYSGYATSGQVFFFASGGVNGQLYQVEISVTTSISENINRTVVIPVLNQ